MIDQNIYSIFNSFGISAEVTSCVPFGHGHINDTYLVRTAGKDSPDFILQRKNHMVFKDVPGMVNNILQATNHIRAKLLMDQVPDIDRKVMKYFPARDGQYFTRDDAGNFWTLFLFVLDSHGIEEVTIPEQAFSAGKAFGRFQLQLSDLDGTRLIETIPNFHNGIYRFRQFEESVGLDLAGRVPEMAPVIASLMDRKNEMLQLQNWLDMGELPLRITHNDTKINNILFDEKSNILCIIDLDTVMPGSILFDFGDAIRTLGNSAAEDEADLSKIRFQSDYFEAFTKGYLSESNGFLTEKERSNLVYSCRYMVWEQAIRFLTDYLNGDTYYKIEFPEHNKVRTLSQLHYLEVLEENEKMMDECVKGEI
jgi:Ser/Thr protein kinase RdoA (MazF antagonist)